MKGSDTTVKRRRKELGLMGSRGSTSQALPHAVKEQLVVDQMNKDPAKRRGVNTVWQKIAFDEEVHLTK